MQSEQMKEENKTETTAAKDVVAKDVVAKDVVEVAVVEDEVNSAQAEDKVKAAAVDDEGEVPVAEDKVEAAVVTKEDEAEEVEAKEVEAKEVSKNTNQRWYVVHAYSGFEPYVKKVLESRIATSEHKNKFGNIMVPTEEVVEMREGNRRKSERKFFPGYVLVQMEMDSDTWHMVKQVPKVLGFIGGTSDKPAPITEAEADAILNRVEEGVDRPRPKVLFEVGEVVRVNDGPFNDFNGVVEEVNYEKSKMLVSVQIFGRSTPVELAFGQVEKG
jgi:transcriptional antiterminator NusG